MARFEDESLEYVIPDQLLQVLCSHARMIESTEDIINLSLAELDGYVPLFIEQQA